MQGRGGPCEITGSDTADSSLPTLAPMTRSALAVLALLLVSGCTWEGRPDGGSARHTDNGALEAHREAVAEQTAPEVVEPLGEAAPATPVPTPSMGTVSQSAAGAPADTTGQ